jgi:hypothetical protein
LHYAVALLQRRIVEMGAREQLSGWPVVQVNAELLRDEPATLLRWVGARCAPYSLVVDARRGVKPPAIALGSELDIALRSCVRVAVCVGARAALGIVWHHQLRGVSDMERRLFVDVQRSVLWAREPHTRARASWVSIAPAMRSSVF